MDGATGVASLRIRTQRAYPPEARSQLNFVWLETVDDALTAALTEQSEKAPALVAG
jgi:hypothetical protein